jgi:ABC-type bacteriocin/lantibiotic exporters, contain an N-terminal double-glycine peptidase domain
LAGLFQKLDKLVDRLLTPGPQPAPQTPPPQQPPKAEPKPEKKPEKKPETKPKPEPKPQPKPEPKPQPKPQPKPAPKLPAMNKDNFISQYRSASNTNEDAARNGNCGPTSLTMIAEAFGKLKVTPGSANKAIEETRRRMGAGTSQSSEYNGTSYAQLQQGAKSYGLSSKVVYGSTSEIQKELKAGRLVIAHVRPDYLFPGTTSGHYAVVTKVAGGKVYMHDPANANGPMVVSEATFKKAQKGRGTWGLVSVGR